ncbi:telomerase protein component 1 [Strongylocentrotus purpuratus]|uniref:TROVE domain-containing protein n=1 Tax=Strongylocentrotus purpuratus TaxID=7668 RepID=A0A7M7ST41_STRPU|nr:telomerase protein component 1 [Strongylocentrotus purpuratus]
MSFLSNPLLAGSTSAKSKASGLTATKRKASNGNQAQGSAPSKQPTTEMSLQSSSLLLGSSLLGGNSKFGLGLQSSSLGTKSPLMASTGFNSKPQGSSGSGRSLLAGGSLLSSSSYLSSSSSLSSSTYGSSPAYGSSVLPNKQKTRSLSRSNSNQVDDSKTKKVKSQHHPEQTKVKEDSVIDPTLTTCELPDYDFSRQLPVTSTVVQEYVPSFEKLDMVNTLSTNPGENYLTELKQQFINAVSASLIGGPNFHERADGTRKNINRQATSIIDKDPEFILKVALYTRKELNIRTTANFLLALAAMTPDCRPFLRKYFSTSVALPSDWIDVAELYQTFHDKNINYGSLPSALRKAMIDRFPRFDQYQLAKYNKEKKKKKKPVATTDKPAEEKPPSDSESDDDKDEDSDTDEEEMERLSFTLKQLIRKLHIKEPVDSVMCLLGKRYPEDMETFYASRLSGTWDTERAGKRMKLPTPETWETQVSLKGNKAAVWEQLIDNKKLPFMAMLRNLRNMIAAGISEKHHKWVLYKLTDRGSVVYSKQFPFRFFSAYEVLTSMEYDLKKADKLKEQLASGIKPPPRKQRGKKEDPIPKWKRAKMDKKLSELPYDISILNRYRKALDSAVKIATSYNVKPIPGKTLLLCHVGKSMERPCTSAKGLGKKRTVLEVGVLLGLMCKYSCENCDMLIFGGNSHRTVELESGTILDNMASVLGQAQVMMTQEEQGQGLDPTILGEILKDRDELDNLVILSNSAMQEGKEAEMIKGFLTKYRRVVNENLLYVSVDLSGGRCSLSATPSHPNDIYIAGYSDQILRFIAERGDTGQVTHVQNIDKAYNLDDIKIQTGKKKDLVTPEIPRALPAPQQTRRHHTVRVFISSTFRDMHGERDLLTRFVFPELRAKARTRFVNLYEVDLRWGVSEEQTKHSSSVEVCLQEANRCDLFIGILGDRYGYVPNDYPDLSDNEDFNWLSTHPKSRSITELEMYHKALRHSEGSTKAFFFIRSSEFVKHVPNKLRSQFEDESSQSKEKLASLKETIRTSGCEVFDGYPCHFGGVVEGKPVVVNLEEFGRRVINNVWNHIKQAYPEDGEILDEVAHERAQHDMFLQSQLATFTGRKTQVKQCLEAVKKAETGIIMVTGKQGCGKTALMASVVDTLQSKSSQPIIVHFVGAVPGSSHVSPLLKRLCNELVRRFGLQSQVPQEYKNLVSEFPRFLEEAAGHVDSTNKLIIVIDGISGMDAAHQAHNLDWLPQNIPQNVLFIVSAVMSSPAHAAVVRRQATMVELGPLDLMDKAEVVRRTLAAHHKKLDESPFNNQMKLLVSKREANLPLFLKLACEELRVFGVFEEVSTRLKAMSHTIGTLLQEVLKRLEDDHGLDMINMALALLVSTRDGLYEEDLHYLLSLHQQMKDSKYTYKQVIGTALGPEVMLPQAVMSRLVRGIRSLLAPTGEHSDHRLRVSHGQISQAIIQRYMKGAASELQIRTHALLAGYFTHLSRTKNAVSPWSPHYPHALSEMPYHLVQAGLFGELKNVLSDPFYIQAKCVSGLTASLLEDFQANTSTTSKAILREREKFLTNPLIASLRSFVSRHLHILTLCPGLLWQQAMNEPDSSLVRHTVLESAGCREKGIVAWRNKRETADECSMTLTGFTDAVLCVAIAPGDQVFAVGTKNCQLKLFEMDTGKELKSYIGHSDAVTSCCFVGRTRLVSASRDKTLSLWDVDQGFRVNILKGHRGLVSGCISDPKGVNLASCGWDCRVLIWDGRSGKQTTDITEPRPISCLSYHPEGKLLVTGSWDSTLKIWDTFNKKRVAILRGHHSSVRAVTYSPTGRHIASASLDGAVKLWSADTGTQVGSLCGHSQPINHIAFSKNGRELVTVSNDHKTKIWSGNLGKQLATFKGKDESASTQAAFSADGEFVAMGYHSGEVKVIEVASKREVFTCQDRESRVKGIAWLLGMSILVGYESGHAVIFKDIETTKPAVVPLKANHAAITSLAYCNGSYVAAITYDNMCVALWKSPMDAKGGKEGIEPTYLLHPKCNGLITCCTFNQYGTRLVLGTRDAMLFMYEINYGKPTSKPILHLDNCHKDWINSCAWSPATDVLATASNDSTIKLWDMKTGKVKCHLKGHQAAVYSVAFSHGCVVSGCLDASVKVWSHRGVEITTLYGHSQKVNKVDIHIPNADPDVPIKDDVDSDHEGEDDAPGAKWSDVMDEEDWKNRHEKKKLEKDSDVNLEDVIIASASDDGTTQLWKPLQSNELTTLIGHSDRVLSVAMATSGQVVTASMDCTVKIWTPQLSPDLVHVGAHDAEVSAVAISTKTNFAVTASRNGSACLWKINGSNKGEGQTMKLLHTWIAAECSINAICFIGKHMTFVLGKDDGFLTLWKIQELKDKPGSYTAVRGKNRFLNVYAFTSMSSPVTCLKYDDAQDILHVGTWSSVITLRGFTSNKIKQNAKSVSDWVLDLALIKEKGVAASLCNGTVAYCKEKSIETLDVSYLSPFFTPWCHSLIVPPPEIGNAKGFLIGDWSDGLMMHVEEDRSVQVIKQIQGGMTSLALSQQHIISASNDGTVKFWNKDLSKQVGQFFCPSPVTSLTTMSRTSNTILCGDQLGNVYLLEWKQ